MEFGSYLLLAAVQGITEFLPVSSSGHLVLLESFLTINIQEIFFFNIFIHLATLLATITFYRHDLWLMTRDGFYELTRLPLWNRQTRLQNFPILKFGSRVLLTTLVTGVIGVTVKPWVANFHHFGLLAFFFCLTGLILLSTKFKNNQIDENQLHNHLDSIGSFNLSITVALIIGLVQGLSVFPGISRSGSTIAIGILLGLSSRKAMKYSILISIPVIMAAFLLEMSEFIKGSLTELPFLVYAWSFLISFGIGYLSLHILFKVVRHHRIHLFSLYLIPLSLGLGVYFFFRI